MKGNFKPWLTPPIFSDDESKTRRANWLNQSWQVRTILAIGVFAVYAVVYQPLRARLGVSAGLLALGPVTLTGLFFGWPGGLVAGLAIPVLNTLLVNLSVHAGWDVILRETNGLGPLAIMSVGLIVGYGRDLTRRLQQQIAARQQAEAEREQYFKFFETAADLMVIADPNGAFLKTNPACTQVLGYSAEELVSKPFIEFVHPDDRQSTLDEMARQLQKGFSLNFENRYVCWDGAVRWLSWRAQYNATEGRTYASARDITEYKRAEEKLRASEQSYRVLVDNSPDNIIRYDCNYRILLVNRPVRESYRQLFGLDEKDILGKTVREFGFPEDQAAVWEQDIQAVVKTGAPTEKEYVFSSPFGIEVYEWRGIPEFDVDGQVQSVLCLNRNITERKQAEADLRRSEESLKESQKIANMGSWEFDLVTRTARWSENCYVLYGFQPNEIEPTFELFRSMVHPDDVHIVDETLTEILRAKQPMLAEFRVVLPDDVTKWVQTNMVPIVEAGVVIKLSGIQIDITERKQAEEKLKTSEEKFRALFNVSPVPLFLTEVETGLVHDANQAASAMFEYSSAELFGKTTLALGLWLSAEDRQTAKELLLAKGFVRNHETRVRTRTGKIIDIFFNSDILWLDQKQYLLTAYTDITERKHIEAALRKSEALLQTYVSNAPLMVSSLDRNGVWTLSEGAGLKVLGLKPGEVVGKSIYEINRELPDVLEAVRSALAGQERTVVAEAEGHVFDVRYVPIRDKGGEVVGAAGVTLDITDRIQAEKQLRISLAEKEVLLKEVHHRVKNNLQVMVSLLNLQAARITDPDSLAVFQDSCERVRTMALVHEKLYQSPDLSHIDFGEYLTHLATNLQYLYQPQAAVDVKVEAEEIWLGVDTAIPCGLLANELISNAFKYAYPAGGAGRVRVVFQSLPHSHAEARQFRLVVSDDGVGLPPGLNVDTTESLGLQLVHLLTQQLNGQFTLSGPPGVTAAIHFAERKERSA